MFRVIVSIAAAAIVAACFTPTDCVAQTDMDTAAQCTVAAVDPPADSPPDESTESFEPAKSRPKGMWAGDAGKFFAGAFTGLIGHEGGHYIANAAVGSKPYLKSVNYGPIPFFTIEPQQRLSRRDHFITASAGFNAQHIINEAVLTKHPRLIEEDEPFLKGLVTFNFWLTVGYAATAFAGTGPAERDTRGMADALGVNEPWVGAMILVPTALDTYRYKHPDAKWARTASRISKLLFFGVSFTIDN